MGRPAAATAETVRMPRRGGPTPPADDAGSEESGYVSSAFRRREKRRDFGADEAARESSAPQGPAGPTYEPDDDVDPYGPAWFGAGDPDFGAGHGDFDPDDPWSTSDPTWRQETPSRSGGVWGRAAGAAIVLLLFSGTVELLTREPLTPSGDDPSVATEQNASSAPGSPAGSGLMSDATITGDERIALSPDSNTDLALRSGQAEVANPPAASVEDPPAVSSADSPSSDRTSVGSERVLSTSSEAPPQRTPTAPVRTGTTDRSGAATSGDATASVPGRLSLQSYPWAEVYLDGDYLGNSPLVDVRVSPGTHQIRVERIGYEPYLREVTVQPGQALRLTGIVLTEGGS
jgi:hypothetical protein